MVAFMGSCGPQEPDIGGWRAEIQPLCDWLASTRGVLKEYEVNDGKSHDDERDAEDQDVTDIMSGHTLACLGGRFDDLIAGSRWHSTS
jgi:hypothetical protein